MSHVILSNPYYSKVHGMVAVAPLVRYVLRDSRELGLRYIVVDGA